MRYLFLIASFLICSCSWRMFTEGEVNEVEFIERIPVASGTDSLDTYTITSVVKLNGFKVELVEMEVGELLEGQGTDPDTLVIDHTN